MNLGTLIETLERMPADARVRFDSDVPVGALASYRGYYEQLALGTANTEPTVAAVLEDARAADGGTFQGYKGGDFVMGRHTAVWADNIGDYSSVAITGARLVNGVVELTTMSIRDYA